MTNNENTASETRQPSLSRRSFVNRAAVGGAAALVPAILLGSSAAQAQTPVDVDIAVLNFALNLEYLEAEYYLRAVTGKGLEANGVAVSGSGPLGQVVSKANPKVPFLISEIEDYAQEIAADEKNHVTFLRAGITALGGTPAARPAIDLVNSFTTLARAAGIISGTDKFDPFLNDITFMLGAFIFEDVGVTAYKGAARLITNKDYLEAAAGILGVEAYHASLIRTILFQQGKTIQNITDLISALRAKLSGKNDDQGVSDGSSNPNIVPTDSNSLVFSRSTRQVLNIVYGAVNADRGLFYPNGMNGQITK